MSGSEKVATPPPAHTAAMRSSATSTIVGSTLKGDVEHAGTKSTVTLWEYLMADVDPAQTTGPLAAYCFMTGYMCVVSVCQDYVGSQTHIM